MFVLNGKRVLPYEPFDHDGVHYPPGWLLAVSADDRKAIGVEERPDPARPDDRFYDVAWSDQTLTWSATPKDLAALKKQFIDETRAMARALLETTDWQVIRAMDDPTQAVSAELKGYRRGVRDAESAYSAKVALCATLPDLEEIVLRDAARWPLTPENAAQRPPDPPNPPKGPAQGA